MCEIVCDTIILYQVEGDVTSAGSGVVRSYTGIRKTVGDLDSQYSGT